MTETSTSRNITDSNTANTSMNRFYQTVLLVGGGPSGASAAKAMVDRGYKNVHLYEAYPHPKDLSKTSSKAYVIALSPRGQQGILDATGIDMLKEGEGSSSNPSIPGVVVSTHMARHVHNPRKHKTSSKARNNPSIARAIVTRQALTKGLLDVAQTSGAHIHYQHRLVDIDFDQKLATFQRSSGNTESDSTVNVRYDLLIAADGCHSKVRSLMVENQTRLRNFSAKTKEDSMEYQVVVLPQNPFETSHPKHTVHSWNHKALNSICLGFPTQNSTTTTTTTDNTSTSMLFAIVFPEGQLESFRSSGYKEPLTQLLPDLFEGPEGDSRLQEFESQLSQNQIANGGLCVWSSSLGHAESGILLLGDSGHGMWPSLGQGANCALESVGVFCKCLDKLEDTAATSTTTAGNDNTAFWIGALIREFSNARSEDAVAAVDLTYGGIGARQSRGRLNAPLSSKLQMIGMMLLHKLTLGVLPMPALLKILMGSNDLSYSTAKKFHFGYEKYICGTAALLVLAGMATFLLDRGVESGVEL